MNPPKKSIMVWTAAAHANVDLRSPHYSHALLIFLLSASCLLLSAPTVHADTTTGLVGWWTFNGKDTNWATGITNDLSGQGDNGSLVSMSTSTSPVSGKLGQALNLNGSNSYVNADSGMYSISVTNVSVSLWEKTTSSADMFVYSQDSSISPNPMFGFRANLNGTSNDMMFGFRHDGSWGNLEGAHDNSTVYRNGLWHHFVGTRSGNVVTLYRDGVQVAQTTLVVENGTLSSLNQNRIGVGDNTIPVYFNGSIDDVRVYNRALSASDVAQLYKQGQSRAAASPVNSLTNGLIGYWPMDGKTTTWTGPYTGTTNDISGSGNTGTLTNMGMATSTVAGKLGQALQFDGSNSTVKITSPPSTAYTAETVSLWFKPASLSVRNGLFGTGANRAPFLFTMDTTSNDRTRVEFEVGTASSGTDCDTRTATGALATSTWAYITATWDGTTCQVYINSVPNGTSDTSVAHTALVGSPWYIGDINTLSPFTASNGIIDDVRFYNRALSQSEIQQLYKLGQTRVAVSPVNSLTNGLVGYWPFDGKYTNWTGPYTGTTNDVSGSGNTGTLTNMSQATSTVVGKLGQALKFVAANGSQVSLANTTSYTGTILTVSVWAKRADALTTEQALLYTDIGYEFYNNNVCIEDFSGGRLSGPGLCTTATYTDQKWHHYVFIADGTNLKIYVDGVLTASTAETILDTGSKNGGGMIGSSNSRWFNGSLDDVRIYSRALSASEVLQLYKLGAGTSH